MIDALHQVCLRPIPAKRIAITLLRGACQVLVLVAIGVQAAVAAAAAAGPVMSPLAEGGRLLSAGRYVEAETVFRQAAENDSLCAVSRAGQGAALFFSGQVEAAEEHFRQALELDPNCVSAMLGQGVARYSRGRTQEAMVAYRQALAYHTPYRGEIRACVAHLACMSGFYQAAEIEAASVVEADEGAELALQVLASCYLAGQRPDDAIRVLARPIGEALAAYPGLTARSALFAPDTAYYVDHGLEEQVRLAALDRFGVRPTVQVAQHVEPIAAGSASEDDGLSIEWPTSGARVNGAIEVAVGVPGDLQLDYIALLLDDRFVGVSNARPFSMYVDTRNCPDGLRELRCEAYGPGGRIVGRTSRTVVVANGSRTLMASETAIRAEVDLFLQQCLLLRADPLLRSQLSGHALMMASRPAEAVNAFEYGFSYNPRLPGLRADLLLAYHELSLLHDGPAELHRLDGSGNRIALTFDDGPHPVLTPILLDLLDRYGVKATFLLVGKQAETYPELVKLIADRGHELGNHSYSHRNLSTLSQLEIERELIMTRQIIRRAGGGFVTLFRPPGGHYNSSVRQAAQITGHTTVFWNENIGNYEHHTPAEACRIMLDKMGASNIVLLHNGYDKTPEVLPLLLPQLVQRGYVMDTVSALTAHQPVSLEDLVSLGPPGWQLP